MQLYPLCGYSPAFVRALYGFTQTHVVRQEYPWQVLQPRQCPWDEWHLPGFEHNAFRAGQNRFVDVQFEGGPGAIGGYSLRRRHGQRALQFPVAIVSILSYVVCIAQGFFGVDVADDGILIGSLTSFLITFANPGKNVGLCPRERR